MNPSTLATPAVVPFATAVRKLTAGWKLLDQPSQPWWPTSRYWYTFGNWWKVLSANWIACTYTPVSEGAPLTPPLAATQAAMAGFGASPTLVIRLGSESSSTTRTKRIFG